MNSGSRSLTSVSRISNKTLLLWRPSETCTYNGGRDTVNAETKNGWQNRTTKNLHCIVFPSTDTPRTDKQRQKFSLFKQKCTPATYYKFVEVLGLSIQQRFHSYDSKVFAISFDGLNIQVIIWVAANDAIC